MEVRTEDDALGTNVLNDIRRNGLRAEHGHGGHDGVVREGLETWILNTDAVLDQEDGGVGWCHEGSDELGYAVGFGKLLGGDYYVVVGLVGGGCVGDIWYDYGA